jgi:hypothetical protein
VLTTGRKSVSFELSAVSIECKVLGGYPNGRVFLGQDLAMSTWGKKVGINPIVWNAKRAEVYDNLSMHHSGFTIHQSTQEHSPRLGQMNRPTANCVRDTLDCEHPDKTAPLGNCIPDGSTVAVVGENFSRLPHPEEPLLG